MILNLTTQEEQTLMHLVFAGNLLLNGNRLRTELLQDYEKTYDKVIKQYLQAKLKRNIKNCDVDDFCEKSMLTIEPAVDLYEQRAVPYTLAKMLADYKFPLENYDDDTADKNLAAQSLYEDVLERQGVSVVRLDIPDF